jgi:hypothetical protein
LLIATSNVDRLAAHRYVGFVDPSGGSADSFTMAIAHRDGERVVVDAIRRDSPVQCHERLGGLLRYYHQEAA